MSKALNARLLRIEAANGPAISERVKAWLGQRPALTPAEEAAEPEWDSSDLAGASDELRQWLTRGDGEATDRASRLAGQLGC